MPDNYQWNNRHHEQQSVDHSLYDELYYAAEESLPFINKHPYGQPISGRIRRALRAIVVAKLKIENIDTEQPA